MGLRMRRLNWVVFSLIACTMMVAMIVFLVHGRRNEMSVLLSIPRHRLPQGELEPLADYQFRKNSYEEIIKSPRMAEYALQHPTVARILRAQPIGHNPFQIESLDGTDKIRISVAGLEKEQVRADIQLRTMANAT